MYRIRLAVRAARFLALVVPTEDHGLEGEFEGDGG
jgi:hypothetical protein